MNKGFTTEDFIRKSRQAHGDKYDYSKTVFLNARTKVCITCPIHGDFWQIPNSHYSHGCPKCTNDAKKKKVFAIGINNLNTSTRNNGEHISSYTTWISMLNRCYNEKKQRECPTYKGCSVCEDWKHFGNFKEWFDKNHVEGWHLEKDILFKRNTVYSPQTCCFVPQEINSLFLRKQRCRGKFPIGVHKTKNGKKYKSFITKWGERVYLGRYNTPEEAFNAYKMAKETYIKEVADKWKDKIEPRVYEAMYNYKVEITD